jgi:ankyrin repeat protein
MATITSEAKRATDQESLAPLIELCKRGRLFDVQRWIAAGKPVNSPLGPKKGTRYLSPLEYAIDRGFHSLVQVLLEGGAVQEPLGYDCPMNRALRMKRFDIAQLLVEHGFDPKSVDMREVFASWDPQIMEFFIARGADIRTDNPFAFALCNRIRTALKLYKQCREKMPELQEQANIALRCHCKEGNLKWVSLLLWAGADPYKRGTDEPDGQLENDDHGLSALGFAALYRHFEVFELKTIRAWPFDEDSVEILSYLTKGEGLNVLKRLLEKGLNPNDQLNGGCSAIQSCLNDMSWVHHFSTYSFSRDPANNTNVDTSESRERLKAIHLLAKHCGKWVPEEKYAINSARRALLRLKPDYTVEFVWIMSKYQATNLEHIQSLLGTPTMKKHIAAYRPRIQEFLAAWEPNAEYQSSQ